MTIEVILSGSGNWTVPSGVTTVRVHCIGPGAQGRSTVNQRAGAGGGAYTWDDLTVTPGATVAYVVGAENSANNTTFGTVVADRGRQPTSTTGGAGGQAANCTPSGNAFSGGSGGTSATSGAGGGGGAAGPGGAGKNGGAPNVTGAGGGGGTNGGSSTAGGNAGSPALGGVGGAGPTGTSGGTAGTTVVPGGAGSNGSGGGGGASGTNGGANSQYGVWTDDSGGPNNGVTVGPGSGSGGAGNGVSTTPGVATNGYGGGAGGGAVLSAAGGGLIVLEYSGGPTGYTLSADSGSMAFTGQAASTLFGRKVAADAGSVAFTGQSAGLLAGRKVQAAAGGIAFTGQDATLTYTTLSRYVSAAGSDSNDGLTPSTPWQTTSKLNGEALSPGTTVYLRGGDTFGYLELSSRTGVKFTSYGTGRATVSNGNGIAAYGEGDLSGLEIDGVDFVGSGKDVNTAPGIMLYSYVGSSTKWTGVTLRNMVISGFGQTGLLIGSEPGDGSAAGFDGMTIDSVAVSDCDEIGIQVYGRTAPAVPGAHANLQITNCTVDSCDHHGIIVNDVDGGLIEDCVVTGCGADFTGGTTAFMAYDANDVVLRGNEAADQITPNAGGGNGINLDQNCTNCVAEYNFVHGCEGAGIELYGAATGTWANNTVRYNIVTGNGANDQFNGALTIETDGQQLAGIAVYNNVFSAAVSGRGVIRVVDDRCDGFIANNILIAATGVAMIKAQTLAEGSLTPTGLLFAGNDYHQRSGSFSILWGGSSYASVAAWQAAYTTQEKVGGVDVYSTADPLLVDAAGTTVADYKLRPGSPMFDLGLDVEAVFSVANDGGRDYFGGTVPNFAGFNIGADGRAVPLLDAASGAFGFAGQAASLLVARKVTANAGAFAYAGQDADLIYTPIGGYTLAADSGAIAFAGQAAGLLYGRRVAADSAAYPFTGQTASALVGRLVSGATGSFGFAGQDAGFSRTYVLASASASFAFSGQDATLTTGGRKVPADTGAFAFAGQDAGLKVGRAVGASAGAFAYAGQSASLLAGRAFPAAFAQFAFTGQDVSFRFSRVFQADAGAFAFTGQDADLRKAAPADFRLTAESGVYAYAGAAASLTGPLWRPVEPISAAWAPIAPAGGSWAPVAPATTDWTDA